MRRNVAVARVFMLALLLAALLLTVSRASAQEKTETKQADAPKKAEQPPEDRRDWTTKVFQLKYIDPVALRNVLFSFRGVPSPERELKVLSWTGPKELAPAVEDTVRRLDVPPPAVPNVELTFYLLAGLKQPGANEALPADLDGVAKQLKGVFGVSRFSLLETSFVRTRDGSPGKTEGIIQGAADQIHPTVYTLWFDRVSINGDERGKIASLKRLNLRLRVPITNRSADGRAASTSYNDITLETDIEVREGQKVVVGKASVNGSADTLFLVATAKVVD